MSENERKIEEERETTDHWSHEHPLTLVETARGAQCYGCGQRFSRGEQGYGCSKKCGYGKVLHEECAEMATKIRHPLHHQHILIQQHEPDLGRCAVCKRWIWSIGYQCTSSESECEFEMHMRCAQASGVIDAADDDDDEQSRKVIHHPSHPKHELRLFSRNSSFKCDACGTIQKGNSYICTACEYWIHERCASLPQTIKREDHYHSLSLYFHVPLEYIIFDYKCDLCHKYFIPKYWIYHCELCRYAVHIKCAFNKLPHATRRENDDEKGIMEFPISNVAEEQIGAFVMREGGGGAISIPHHDVHDYKFHNHKLKLVSSSSSHGGQNKEENSDDDDDDEDDYGQKSELICDGCITPIFQKQRSSSSGEYDYCYMGCSSEFCKYNLHMACFRLPPQLPSLPLHHLPQHDLILQSNSDKLQLLDEWSCSVCRFYSNGLFYACTRCSFKADIKCASMPETICHAAHPQHPLKHVRRKDIQSDNRIYIPCDAGCGSSTSLYDYCYVCDSCDEFFVHVGCVVLPASTRSRRWDKHHPLLLTYDANLNHPGDFYCDECETQMNPKSWMYHCRLCDLSFHPNCFKTTSGEYRNIKFGHKYVAAGAHPHTLTYQLLTTKRRCDLCRDDWHGYQGFHCASCNFFICFWGCGKRRLRDGDIQAVG